MSSHFGSIVEFRRFPLIWISAFWAKADEAIESLAFYQVIALLRTDRDHEQKLVLTRLFALLRFAVSRLWVVGPSQSFHCASPCTALCIEAPEYTINIRSSVSLAPSQERSLTFGLSLHIFSPNSTLLCWYNLLVVKFPQVVVRQRRARKDFAHDVHRFGWCLQIALFFPESNFVPGNFFVE